MGYLTRYDLEVTLPAGFGCDNEELLLQAIDRRLKKEMGEWFRYVFEDRAGFAWESGLADKWYEHEKHIANVSAVYPLVLFKLHGEGEETGDLWNKYFLGGKVQVCKAHITYDAFDPAKLMEVGRR